MRYCFEIGNKRGALGSLFREFRELIAWNVIVFPEVNVFVWSRFAVVQSIIRESYYGYDGFQFFAVEFFAGPVDAFSFSETIFTQAVDAFEFLELFAQKMQVVGHAHEEIKSDDS